MKLTIVNYVLKSIILYIIVVLVMFWKLYKYVASDVLIVTWVNKTSLDYYVSNVEISLYLFFLLVFFVTGIWIIIKPVIKWRLSRAKKAQIIFVFQSALLITIIYCLFSFIFPIMDEVVLKIASDHADLLHTNEYFTIRRIWTEPQLVAAWPAILEEAGLYLPTEAIQKACVGENTLGGCMEKIRSALVEYELQKQALFRKQIAIKSMAEHRDAISQLIELIHYYYNKLGSN